MKGRIAIKTSQHRCDTQRESQRALRLEYSEPEFVLEAQNKINMLELSYHALQENEERTATLPDCGYLIIQRDGNKTITVFRSYLRVVL